MTPVLAWLRLLRIPNHATAAADVLAGFLIASRAREIGPLPPALWWALAASLAFYAAGMVLNDVFDVELDRRERPERPLPSGAIAVGTAAAVGRGLLTVGSLCACLAAFASGSATVALVGAALAAAVWMYDRHAKGTPLGPAVMGSCRGLNWLLGMTAAGGPATPSDWLIPLGMGLFVGGITLYARDEAGRSRAGTLAIATLVMFAGMCIAGASTWLLAAADEGSAWLRSGRLTPWLLLWSVLGASILLRNVLGILDPDSGRVQQAVGNAIMSMITLAAVLVLPVCGEAWAIVVLLLLVPFLLGRQLVSAT
ncbi:MAG: UbiA family prenyltransferase [Planctomycetia bacterium]